jgi:hypothetical protein
MKNRCRKFHLGDDPVFGAVQQHVGVLRQPIRIQAGGIAAGEAEGEAADVHVLRGEDLDDESLPGNERLAREHVAIRVFVLVPPPDCARPVQRDVRPCVTRQESTIYASKVQTQLREFKKKVLPSR